MYSTPNAYPHLRGRRGPSAPPRTTAGSASRGMIQTTGKVSSGKSNKGALNAKPTTSSVDHWSIVLFYAMSFGIVSVIVTSLIGLILVGTYAELIWAFTHWSLMSVPMDVVESWAGFAAIVIFAAGTCVGIWLFGGFAWRRPRSSGVAQVRGSRAASRS